MEQKTYRLALIGFGNVGRGLAHLLIQKEKELAEDPEITIKITAISDMHLGFASDPDGIDLKALLQLPNEKGALASLPNGQQTADNEAAIKADHVDIVAELTFTNPKTGEPALTHCKIAKTYGKHVITTNKGPVALSGGLLRYDAERLRLAFNFEGSVMSGTPVIRFAKESLAGAKIRFFRGILNGTANYVLGQVEAGQNFDTAISSAQELGYAEADPAADIGGSDVFAKVRILAGELFGYGCDIASEHVTGLETLTAADVQNAPKQNKRWKLIGQGYLDDSNQAHLSVSASLLDMTDPLAGVSGAINAISFGTDVLGEVTVMGPGAGRVETAYALLSDILHIDRNTRQPKFAPVIRSMEAC